MTTIGFATLQIIPSLRGVSEAIEKQIDGKVIDVKVAPKVDERAAEFVRQNDDYNSILFKALADRLAEAFAEHLHERVRREFWGYAADENLPNDALIREEVTRLGRKEGGLMMIYGLYPGVPLANVKALMDAMERYAGYYA